MSKHILIVGGTGLVGSNVISAMANYGSEYRVSLFLRRTPDFDVPANCEAIISPVEEWPGAIAKIKPDAVISCLGTTIRTAGSKEAFRSVDLELVKAVAEVSKQSGAKHFLSVSSLGADSGSSLFYLRTKGEAEDAIRDCGFERADILQPGLLRGDRSGPVRYGEHFAIMLSPISDAMMVGAMRQYRSIAARDVARAMVALIAEAKQGAFIHKHDDILKLAAKARG